jgi:NADP-dependent 3-hydroxy acid dehydrogenase YdfG
MQPLSPEDVAEVIGYMASAPAHVNLADVLLMPAAQASSTVVRRQE